jgi:A/G-specific adenine glycosylase
LVSDCLAFERGVQEERPVRSAPKSIPHYTVAAGVLRRGSKYLIARRPEGKLLGGLWEFPGGKCRPDESLEECLQREWREELGVEVEPGRSLGVYSHAYTHFKVTVHALACKLIGDEPHPFEHMDIRWVQSHELGAFPMGKVDRMIAEEIVEAG